MFTRARIKLTGWYLLILLVIVCLFSAAFYVASTREISRIVDRVERRQKEWQELQREFRPPPPPEAPSLEELQESKRRLLIHLVIINGVILVVAGGLAFMLAGKTLTPIRLMVDEQNQFISHSSHELRTPLASLRAEMEGSLLEKRISDKQARNLIQSNLEEVSRLQRLADNLLQLVKIHSAGQSYTEVVSVATVVTSALKQVKPLAKKKQIQIITVLVEAQVVGDADSLRELVVILLDNAIKYSESHTQIRVSTKVEGDQVVVLVSDQGIGIEKKELAHVFDRFYRVDSSRSQTPGFGLGLSIAKRIVTKHQGEISLVSSLGQGSTFRIVLPLASS